MQVPDQTHGYALTSGVDNSRDTQSNADVSTYIARIQAARGKSARATLKMAALIAEAREALDHASFRKLGKAVGLSAATLSKFVTIHSSRDRLVGRESALPPEWTVMYQVARMPDAHFETLAASGKLGPDLTEKEVKKFMVQREAAGTLAGSASERMDYISVKVIFPGLTSLEREDSIRKRIFASLEDDQDISIRVSQRKRLPGSKDQLRKAIPTVHSGD
ncbi:hypothetical protein AOQ72_05005 [Bradyrhizobium yuanmingense]|uniref:Uncharacterized protein n=1 Tax=Bradyrhizobium yuanmingense TaxID=108015 RepID=A0A0R3BM42_9BRAD|nr:hypothetical protein [Bradyrhizobium yuanmingense]KRP85085.1 hypothetical protein AOQ72_05005 [Bradyrhizobium yuanmingense]